MLRVYSIVVGSFRCLLEFPYVAKAVFFTVDRYEK